METTGEPASVQLAPERDTINADGEDVSVMTVSVHDAEGRLVPVATNLIHFEISGPGKILGVGNGDPSCHEPDVYIPEWPVHSTAIDNWCWERVANPYAPNLPQVAAQIDDSDWAKADVQSASGPLGEREHGVFRATFKVTEQDLAAPTIEMCFGMIDEEGWVYVNGQKAGESHDWRTAPVFNVKPFLSKGENTVAVVVANYNGAGGVNKGVTLQFQEMPEMPEWKRSVFNGLAQIIVQTSKTAGEIKLTASAEGLMPATAVIHSELCAPRPAVAEYNP